MAVVLSRNHLLLLTGNKIGQPGLEALLRAMEYQTKLLADNKSNGTGLMRLVVGVSVLNGMPPFYLNVVIKI